MSVGTLRQMWDHTETLKSLEDIQWTPYVFLPGQTPIFRNGVIYTLKNHSHKNYILLARKKTYQQEYSPCQIHRI